MAALVEKFSGLFFKVRGQEMLGAGVGRGGALKSTSIHMEGSEQGDQKTIGGLDFFDELTNLQIFCRSKLKGLHVRCSQWPHPRLCKAACTMCWESAAPGRQGGITLHSFPLHHTHFPRFLVVLL